MENSKPSTSAKQNIDKANLAKVNQLLSLFQPCVISFPYPLASEVGQTDSTRPQPNEKCTKFATEALADFPAQKYR